MKNYVIHIGLPKTGTTALQTEYFSKIDQSKICYNPKWIVKSLTEILKLIDFDMENEEDIQLLKDVIAYRENEIPQNNILISHEILSQRLGKFDYIKRGKFLKSVFPNATIVMILRYQPNLLRSLYLQFLRQNYFLNCDEVFVQNSKLVFSNSDKWKTSMQIDVKQWNYSEITKYFKSLFGEKFQVYFYEDFPNLIDLGKEIMTLTNVPINTNVINSIPVINKSYTSKFANQILFISRLNLAFRANNGFYSKHINNLMEQANQARLLFNTDGAENFLCYLKNSISVPKDLYSSLDAKILRILKRISVSFKTKKFQLPQHIMDKLENEAKVMNSSLHEVLKDKTIPEKYI